MDELIPEHPEVLPRQPFGLLVAPRWTVWGQSLQVLVNSAFRAHSEILVRVPAWAKRLGLDQPVARWIALQPQLAQIGTVGLIGVETTSAGERALEVFVRADELTATDLKRLAAVAGAPAGELLHVWRSLCLGSADEPSPTLVSLRISGNESLDVGVSFSASRAGSAIEIQRRLQCLARAHKLDTSRYLESILEMGHTSGRPAGALDDRLRVAERRADTHGLVRADRIRTGYARRGVSRAARPRDDVHHASSIVCPRSISERNIDDLVSLQRGHKLAHYEVLEPIGKGGMGEVYRATDTKLGRDVAIKVLPPEFAQDEERLRTVPTRSEGSRVAQPSEISLRSTASSSQMRTHYLVLELVPGETLAQRIQRGPIPVDEALQLAAEIAEALEEPHEQGIVHRDLKPANIKITPDDKVKVLDFGLATVFVDEPEVDSATSMSPTITRDATRVGVILGTAAYMSPEQAKGKRVDKRADIFAFGVVLYEMLTGKKAFPGEDVSDVLASVIKSEPDWSTVPVETPSSILRVLKRCLQKESSSRARDIGDVRIELREAGQAPEEQELGEPVQSSPVRLGVVVSLAAGLALGALSTRWARKWRSRSVRGALIDSGDSNRGRASTGRTACSRNASASDRVRRLVGCTVTRWLRARLCRQLRRGHAALPP